MSDTYPQEPVYTDLRNQVLALTRDKLGVGAPVLAVLMETGYREAVATLVAVADGASSLYFSNGGGIIGAGEYQQVHQAAIALVDKAADSLEHMTETTEFRLPENEFTRFYVVASSGVYTATALEDDLGNERHVLSPVFLQGHELISYIRAAEEHRASQTDSVDG